ncbi:MAG: HlyD family efflux transporter periplasmic adaptor subunit, partial [Planctomycetes bacterium]|nr:HlyD family efflux transporter periplasmic adaptor subunit [Planctomycetota bacterium]
GLVVAEASGQGKQLIQRRKEQTKKKMLAAFTNVLAIRWKGVDPNWVLNWMYKYLFWIYWPAFQIMCLLVGLSALALVTIQFDVFQSRLPAFHEFFGPDNWLFLGLTLAGVKVIHEFGHGLTCKHYGGECHEMGFMLLVLTPCLYCNVSDSWMLPNKWQRAAIGFAGIWVELLLASIATFVWWFSEPGLTINQVALSTMFICSVSTILFNGNPLLRFDGYYILADILEIPNLRQKATEVLRRKMVETCLGIEQAEDPFLPKRGQLWFMMYTVAAVVYRWVVLASILFFLNQVLEPYGLKIIGQMIALTAIVGLVIQPSIQIYRFFHIPGRMHQVKKPRLIATLSVLGAVVAAIVFLPLPFHVKCALEAQARDAESVFVDTPGQLVAVVAEAGRRVEPGQPIAQLKDDALEMTLLELEGQMKEYQAQLESYRLLKHIDPEVAGQIESTEQLLEAVRQQYEEKLQDKERLQIRAPIAGTIIPPPPRDGDKGGQGTLPVWSGSPLSAKNLGARLEESDLVCQVGDPSQMEAVLFIDQGDMELVRESQDVEIKLDAYPYQIYTSTIEEIARRDVEYSPPSLSNQAGGRLATQTDPQTGAQKLVNASYQARAPLDDPRGVIVSGMRGTAKVYPGWKPLGWRMWRWLTRTFNFDM